MTNLIVMALIVTTNFCKVPDPIATSNANANAGITSGYSVFQYTSNAECCVTYQFDIGMPRQNGKPIYLFTVVQNSKGDHWCLGGWTGYEEKVFVYSKRRREVEK